MDTKYLSFMARACTRRSALATGSGLLLASLGGGRDALAQSSEPLKIKGQVRSTASVPKQVNRSELGRKSAYRPEAAQHLPWAMMHSS